MSDTGAVNETVKPGRGRWSLAELAERTGCPPRTIRFYQARGLLPPPRRSGRTVRYGEEHRRRIAEIRARQARGETLAEIAADTGAIAGGAMPPAVPWLAFRVASDVVVQVRADAAPWRLRRIRREVARLAARLQSDGPVEQKENPS